MKIFPFFLLHIQMLWIFGIFYKRRSDFKRISFVSTFFCSLKEIQRNVVIFSGFIGTHNDHVKSLVYSASRLKHVDEYMHQQSQRMQISTLLFSQNFMQIAFLIVLLFVTLFFQESIYELESLKPIELTHFFESSIYRKILDVVNFKVTCLNETN